jgi:hypothetical protein
MNFVYYRGAQTLRPTMGVPQEGIVSPLLFNLVYDKILKELESQGQIRMSPTTFTDDLAIIAISKQLGPVILEVSKCFERVGLEIKAQGAGS